MNNKTKIVIIIGIILILALAALAYFAINKKKTDKSNVGVEIKTVEEKTEKKLEAVFNPVAEKLREDMPKTNPFEADINPFNAYKNPFK